MLTEESAVTNNIVKRSSVLNAFKAISAISIFFFFSSYSPNNIYFQMKQRREMSQQDSDNHKPINQYLNRFRFLSTTKTMSINPQTLEQLQLKAKLELITFMSKAKKLESTKR